MSLLLIRHGETALNVARTLQPPDTPLSDRGHRQSEAVAARLAAGSLSIAAIVSSDLVRARQTAEAIHLSTGAPLELSARWQERSFGDWRGRRYDGLPVDPLTMRDAPPNGESLPAFEQRVAAAFAWALERHAEHVASLDGALAIVTHGLVIRTILARQMAGPNDATAPPRHLGNTSVTVLDAAAPWSVRLLSCTLHLDARLHDDPAALSGG